MAAWPAPKSVLDVIKIGPGAQLSSRGENPLDTDFEEIEESETTESLRTRPHIAAESATTIGDGNEDQRQRSAGCDAAAVFEIAAAERAGASVPVTHNDERPDSRRAAEAAAAAKFVAADFDENLMRTGGRADA
ncbi:hypothetical protein SEPCBS119000_000009 [Sporothrix epigloea]|uniref:Uncharacterized protein n=1 Tax=Sporothrix epigloea TaxID=1892477 RepID=A0ABP0D2U0_9PEZI